MEGSNRGDLGSPDAALPGIPMVGGRRGTEGELGHCCTKSCIHNRHVPMISNTKDQTLMKCYLVSSFLFFFGFGSDITNDRTVSVVDKESYSQQTCSHTWKHHSLTFLL